MGTEPDEDTHRRLAAMDIADVAKEIAEGRVHAQNQVAQAVEGTLGVHPQKRNGVLTGRWVAMVRGNNDVPEYVGVYRTAAKAAKARDKRAFKKWGQDAILNRPAKYGLPPHPAGAGPSAAPASSAATGGGTSSDGEMPASDDEMATGEDSLGAWLLTCPDAWPAHRGPDWRPT